MSINKILLKNIVQDKIEEISLKTRRSAAAKRVAQVRDPKFKGEEVPIYKAGTKEQIGTRRKPGKGVLAKRIAKHYSKDKIGSAPLDIPSKKREDSSSQPVYDRMAEILIERNLFKDIYGATRGAARGIIGLKRGLMGQRIKSRGEKDSWMRTLGGAVGGITRRSAKAVGMAVKAPFKLAKTAMEGEKSIKQTQRDRDRTAKSSTDAAAAKAAAAERAAINKKAKDDADRAEKDEQRRLELLNYGDDARESTSYRDIMLQKIAEMRLVEKLPKDQNINEWIWMIPWAIRAGQLGLSAYRAYRGARALKTAYDVGRTAYGAARAIGAQGAIRQGLSSAGKSLLGSAAKETGKAAATTAADKALGVSSGVKKYVGKKAMKSLAPDAKQVYSGVSKGLSGLSAATRATNSATDDSEKSKKPTRQEEPDDSMQADRSYSRSRGYNPIGDEDDDQ